MLKKILAKHILKAYLGNISNAECLSLKRILFSQLSSQISIFYQIYSFPGEWVDGWVAESAGIKTKFNATWLSLAKDIFFIKLNQVVCLERIKTSWG